jgi:hypothetical protein
MADDRDPKPANPFFVTALDPAPILRAPNIGVTTILTGAVERRERGERR